MIRNLERTNKELPYKIEIDNLSGSGKTPSGAVITALSVGGKIPFGMRNRKDVAAYLLWHYESSPDWVKLIHILENDTFDPYICPECRQYRPDDERVQNGMKCAQCAY